MVGVDWHAYALSYLEDINVFARFDGIPSLPIENIRKNQNVADGQMDGREQYNQRRMGHNAHLNV